MTEQQELQSAIEAVMEMPEDASQWDRVEALMDAAQRPSDVSALFKDVLNRDLSADLASDIGKRAVRFYETWYGEDSVALPDTLERVLEMDPHAEWAFERLTVAYTVAEKWEPLLAAYDRAIKLADQTVKRMKLLEEAAQVAKDFAGAPERAIGYMTQLLALDPANTNLASSLERLLEKLERHAELVALFETRLPILTKPERREVRLRMAQTYLRNLDAADKALEQVNIVLREVPKSEPALSVVAEILSHGSAPVAIRREALQILKNVYLAAGAQTDVVSVLVTSLEFVTGNERVVTLGELVERLVALEDDTRAMPHQAALFQLDPTPKEREALFELATRTRDFEQYQETLTAVARQAQAPLASELWFEAGRILEEELVDPGRAISCYAEAFAADASTPEAAPTIVSAGRRLLILLEQTDLQQDTLRTCERLAELEQDDDVRRRLLGQVARLAEVLGDDTRARQAWQARVGEDAQDVEALDALIRSAEERQEWTTLATLLRGRIKAPAAAERRRTDLTSLAGILEKQLGDLDSAIDVWREIQQLYGEDRETVNALADLLSRAERWGELAELLQQAAAREISRFTELQVSMGDAFRLRLGKPVDAAKRYRSALQVDCRHPVARAGLTALLDDEGCVVVAANALSDAYAETDEWELTLSILESRLLATSSDVSKAAVLVESAEMHEKRGGDAAAALTCLRRAFTLTPNNRNTEREIRRLAEMLSAWDAVVASYRETIATFESPTERMAELRFDEGEVLERRVGAKEAALFAYRQAMQAAPKRVDFAESVVRLAGQLGRNADIATSIVSSVEARGVVEPSLLSMAEQVAASPVQWTRIGSAMMDALAGAELPGPQKRELYCWVARARREECNDREGTEAALLQASLAEPDHVDTLQLLAAVQREAPGRPLVDTLLKIVDRAPMNLDPLQEASEVALELGDMEHAQSIVQRLYNTAASMFRHGREAVGERDSQNTVTWALERLSRIHLDEGRPREAMDLLIEAASLPFDSEAVQGLMHEAAQLAADAARVPVQAIQLYRDILQLDPRDVVATERLGKLYREADRLPELLMLRRQELSLGPTEERSLWLRLEIASILGEVESRRGRVDTLKDNLTQAPGHRQSMAALSALLREKGQEAELVAITRSQAKQLAQSGKVERAAELFRDAACIYETDLGDKSAALDAYRSLYDLEPQGDAAEHLAQLSAGLGEHAAAAEWLERRVGTVEPERHVEMVLWLAHEHRAADQDSASRACLEQLLAQRPEINEARRLLAELYRKEHRYDALAQLLWDGVEFVEQDAEKLSLLIEVADLYHGPLGAPNEAAPALLRARRLAPDDDRIGAMLAQGLRAAGRYDEAATVLQELIAAYGRKRSTQRADLHFQLASVLEAGGDRTAAIAELETATKMDLAHVQALHALSRTCRQDGQLDRSERAYRGLLLLVRRQQTDNIDDVGPSEVFYELYCIARERGQEGQADEMMRSAMEMAASNDVEAARFQRVLLAHSEFARALTVINVRLNSLQDTPTVPDILSVKADVLEEQAAHSDEAIEVRMQVLALRPHSDAMHAKARATAARFGALPRYLDACSKLADELVRREEPGARRQAAQLQLRMGQAIEQELKDLDRAAAIYGRVEASGECAVEAWLAMARVAGARGEHAEQRRVLEQISELGDEQASPASRADALFLLAELAIGRPDSRLDSFGYIERALAINPDYVRAKALLREVLSMAEGRAPALALVYKVARESHDDVLLLDWHTLSASMPDVEVPRVREGVDLALRLGAADRAEQLLQQAASKVREHGKGGEAWVFSKLAQCRAQAGDMKGALATLQEALSHVSAEEAGTLQAQLADLALQKGGDPRVAAQAYEAMLARDPGNRRIWEPLFNVYRGLSDRGAIDDLVARTLPQVQSSEGRRDLQLAQGRFLIELGKADASAIAPLAGVLSESPAHAEATELLMGVYRRLGMVDELATMLWHQFDEVCQLRDLSAISQAALRLGNLYPADRSGEAIDVYRVALQWAPTDVTLLRALLERLGSDGDLRERAEVMHALLMQAQGIEVVRLAKEVADMWDTLQDDVHVQEALELGYRANPEDGELRTRLQQYYVEREQWQLLADFLMAEAKRVSSPEDAVALYRTASGLLRDQLGDADGSVEALRKALELVPGDPFLLGEFCRSLASTGQSDRAYEELTRLLDGHKSADAARIELLRVRSELLRNAERHAEAVADLEEAYAIEPQAVIAELIDGLDILKGQAFVQAQRDVERAAALRLVELYDASGNLEQGRELLAQWCEAESNDVEALRALRQRDEVAERYADLADTCLKLIGLEQGEACISAALGLFEACERLGQPEAAREGLERAYADARDNALLRERLRKLYEATGAHAALAGILMDQAAEDVTPNEERIPLYHRAAELYLSVADPNAALDPLARAQDLAPEDHRNQFLRADILLQLSRFDDARRLLEQAMDSQKRKRSPELAQLQLRMAKLCALQGDSTAQMDWLQQAADTDRKSGEIAAAIVEASLAVEDYDGALKALRNITMMDDPQPITRAMAFLKQAQIAAVRGDTRRAQHWARKAKSLDEALPEVDALLAELGD